MAPFGPASRGLAAGRQRRQGESEKLDKNGLEPIADAVKFEGNATDKGFKGKLEDASE